ncbi:hypothetical protein E6P78_21110 [Streptomyces sp. A0958]|nr:hypothetical protein E6P78_21110 [Streptomyces sp. A0958]
MPGVYARRTAVLAVSAARTHLSRPNVNAEGPPSGYGRGKPQDSSRAAVSGSRHSEYDSATWTAASDLDIDHVLSAPATA